MKRKHTTSTVVYTVKEDGKMGALIAAAPDFLAALREIATWNCPHYRGHQGDVSCGSCAAAFKRIAREALARAGEE